MVLVVACPVLGFAVLVAVVWLLSRQRASVRPSVVEPHPPPTSTVTWSATWVDSSGQLAVGIP
jgi:hypothetical protein